MAISLFDRVTAALFGGSASPEDATERQLIADMTELVVEAVEPRVRFHGGYEGKLEGCVRASIAHLRAIGRQQLDPILLARAAWNDDPRLSAFFATVDDIPACLGRSNELRAFFEDSSNREIGEAYALLAMKKEERTVFAPQLEGEVVRHDVAQTNVNFSQHTLIAPTATLAATRLEVGKRIIKRLAQVALSRIVALDMKATELNEHKAYLGARLRLLNLARDGMEGIVKDQATAKEEMKTLQRELKQTVDGYIEAKTSLTTLQGYINHIDDVFSHAEQHVTFTNTPLRLSRMGAKVSEATVGPVSELTLAELSIGEDLRIAIAIARCPRSEVPPKEDLIAKAERYL